MIKADRGNVQIEGGAALLQAELSCLVKGLHETFQKVYGEKQSQKMLMMAVEDAFKTEDELSSDLEKKLASFIKSILTEV